MDRSQLVQQKNVSFQVVVNTIPTLNVVSNGSSASYQYTVNPSQSPVTKNISSNLVSTQINNANLALTKSTNKQFATIGNTISYTILISNSGNTAATNVQLTDPLPNGTILTPGTVTLNGVLQNVNSLVALPIGTIPGGATFTLSFQVTVINITAQNPIINNAFASYLYTVNPSLPPNSKTANSNSVTSTIRLANLQATKSVDKTFAEVGDILTYTFALTNNGNVTANNVLLSDSIANGTSFVPNSVIVNGVNQPGATPASINIGSINANTTITASFQVLITSIPNPNPISNSASISYNFIVDPNASPVSKNTTSTTTFTQVNDANVISAKTVDKGFATVGDVLTYTVVLTNAGSVSADSPTFVDTNPDGTTFIQNTFLINGVLGAGASFVQNSVTINNIPRPGLDPSLGIHLADIPPGDTVFITFQAQILAIPPSGTLTNNALVNYEYTVNPNQSPAVDSTITNTTVTPIIDATLVLNKNASTTFATIGDTITFTSSITNTGNTTANNIVFTDSIPNGTTFVPNSFKINGVTVPNANPQNGINIGNLNANASITLNFQVNITTSPNPNPLPNKSSLQYNFIVDINEPPVSRTVQSNKTFTQVNTASVIATKTASSAFAAVGDTITYTTTLTNSGNTTANTPVFIDILPPELSFVPDSVQINSIPQLGFRPDSGISLDAIPVGGTITISFQAIVGSIPATNPTLNQSSTTYSIIVDPNQCR